MSLPISSEKGTYQNYIDALFNATSALSTTGLAVCDVSNYYNWLGELTILTLIQIGGLGYMIFVLLIMISIKDRLSFQNIKILRDSFSKPEKISNLKFAKIVLIFTIIIEGIGAILLFFFFREKFTPSQSIYLSIFHSISAFCTAGFSTFSDNFIGYKDHISVNIIINILCILGAAGFFVLYDYYALLKRKFTRTNGFILSLHTKIVTFATILLTISGSILVFVFDLFRFSDNIFTQILYSTFQVISGLSTTGFNSVNIKDMSEASIFVLILLMFIGASPGSTGGGIKTTSFSVLFKFCISVLMGKTDVVIFKRRINQLLINKVLAIFFGSLLLVIVSALILMFFEKIRFLPIFFEVVSAFGTVGLSTGITANLTPASKIVLTALMLIGRIGTLAFGISILNKKRLNTFKYPTEDIIIS
ncbi:MAG: TrkH family potassium uptake protein [Ignavibacteriaceae bacterium]